MRAISPSAHLLVRPGAGGDCCFPSSTAAGIAAGHNGRNDFLCITDGLSYSTVMLPASRLTWIKGRPNGGTLFDMRRAAPQLHAADPKRCFISVISFYFPESSTGKACLFTSLPREWGIRYL